MPSALLAILLLSAPVAASASRARRRPAPDRRAGLDRRPVPSLGGGGGGARRARRLRGARRGGGAAEGAEDEDVALRGRLVTPGFEDAHLHLMSGARNLERVDLAEETTLAGLQERIRTLRRGQPEEPLDRGTGLGLRVVSRRPPHARAARRDRSRPAGLHGLLRRPHRLGQQQGARPRRHHEGDEGPGERHHRARPEDGRAHRGAEGSGGRPRRGPDPRALRGEALRPAAPGPRPAQPHGNHRGAGRGLDSRGGGPVPPPPRAGARGGEADACAPG